MVNAFQGVIPETEIIKFLEKSLGNKLKDDFEDFYKKVSALFNESKFLEAKNLLEEFIAEHPEEIGGISLYAESLIELNEINSADEFLNSLNDELVKKEEIKKIHQRIILIKETEQGPSLKKLSEDLKKNPGDLDLVFKITDSHFANNNFDYCFETLLTYYPKNKDEIKSKMLGYFNVLGFEHESTVTYRKKLSSIMFS